MQDQELRFGTKELSVLEHTAGARYSSIYMSLIELAIINDLDPYRYLEYILDRLFREVLEEEGIKEVLPYSKSIPDKIKVHLGKQ